MKNFLQEVISVAFPKFSLLIEFMNKPILALLAITPTIVVTPVVDLWGAVYVLVLLFFGDLVTGVLASYFDWKKSAPEDKWFFGKGEGFSSDKFKKMFVKMIIYLGTPLVVQKFQAVFMIKNMKFETISNSELSIATFLILIFCLNEGFSIFHENLPRCGFNLWERIQKMIGFYKEAKKDLTE